MRARATDGGKADVNAFLAFGTYADKRDATAENGGPKEG
jgi:hypothetical protein